ncbi:MAG: hypothetical protein ABI113_18020, partial [Mucilaginibacter sp.]
GLLPVWKLIAVVSAILIVSLYLIHRFFKFDYTSFQSDAAEALEDDARIALIEKNVIIALRVYHKVAVQLRITYVIIGTVAILCSVFVTTFISGAEKSEYKQWLPFVSFASTASLTLITAFNLGAKGNNCRNAYRHLENSYMRYKAEPDYTLADLVKAKNEAEKIIGGVDFQYNPKA